MLCIHMCGVEELLISMHDSIINIGYGYSLDVSVKQF